MTVTVTVAVSVTKWSGFKFQAAGFRSSCVHGFDYGYGYERAQFYTKDKIFPSIAALQAFRLQA